MGKEYRDELLICEKTLEQGTGRDMHRVDGRRARRHRARQSLVGPGAVCKFCIPHLWDAGNVRIKDTLGAIYVHVLHMHMKHFGSQKESFVERYST
jgi:hypothetical protein